MGNATQKQKPIVRSREIRLGLVMYGGISLAIYINGVSREFYRAVRGESIYKLIKAFTDSDIVVDIVSGTSAGGVNGIFLGYALCNKADFATTAELWRKAGNIGALVRDPDNLNEPVLSVLDGEGHYQSELQDAFSRMDKGWDNEEIEPSPLTEMDVFITSTDVDGRISNWVDEQGRSVDINSVDIKDHRSVFKLKFRKGRNNDFAPDADKEKHRALAKLARMTSCFPAAFPPVRVVVNPRLEDVEDRNYWTQWQHVDKLIAGWGKLTKDDSFFLDGGLLDNKPFTHTIREIFYRLADRPVERRLFYVEPDPKTFEHNASATQVNVLQAVQRALITIPGYESIAGDLKMLSAHNEKIDRYERLISLGSDRSELHSAGRRAKNSLDQESLCFITRIQALERGEKPEAATGTSSRYAKARFVTLSERAVRGILKSNVQKFLNPKEMTAAKDLYQIFDKWEDPDDPDGDLTLYHFDVYFRLRRLFHVLYACPDPGLEETESDKLRGQFLRAMGRQIKLLEILQAAMEKLVDDGNFRWSERAPLMVWDVLKAAYQVLLNNNLIDPLLPHGYTDDWGNFNAPREPWLDQNALNQVYQCLFGTTGADILGGNGRIDVLHKQLLSDEGPEAPSSFVSVLTLTDACERRMLRYFEKAANRLSDPTELPLLEQIYDDFLYIDADLFTLQTFADLTEKDIIKTVRISPRDAKRSFCNLDSKRKVAGDTVFHFGGFFKKSWRANDILWGRLDGVCKLTETLLDRERVIEVIKSGSRREVLKKDIMAGGKLHPVTLFPKALPKSQEALAVWFQDLVDDDPNVRNDATEETTWGKYLDLLVEAAQMEFLGDEVKNVIEDAVYEQMEWNFYRKTAGSLQDVDGSGRETKGDFDVGNGRFGTTVHILAAEALSERAISRLQDPSSLKKFFTNEYSVGAESIAEDVPIWVAPRDFVPRSFRGKRKPFACLPSKVA